MPTGRRIHCLNSRGFKLEGVINPSDALVAFPHYDRLGKAESSMQSTRPRRGRGSYGGKLEGLDASERQVSDPIQAHFLLDA